MIKIILLVTLFTIGVTNGYNLSDEYGNSTKFTFDLYRKAFKKDENFVISPISFRILLSLVYQSSIDHTKTELQEKVYLAEKSEASELQKLSLDAFKQSSNIKLVNHIFLKNHGQLNDEFNKEVKKYGSGVERVDFTKKRETASLMNAFVERETHGMIKDLFSEKVITDETALFLVNTIYFKAKWKNPFPAKLVRNRKFHGIDGQEYEIPFMSDIDSYKVADIDELKSSVLEIPYEEQSHFKFWIILPNESESISEVINLLNPVTFKSIKNYLTTPYPYSIALPLFEIESTINGKKLLTEYGLLSIFERHELDMLVGDELKVDESRQKTKIIVNTDGTEASTATYIKGVSRSLHPSFVANRPFIYAVVSTLTDEPVFIGHFVKPN